MLKGFILKHLAIVRLQTFWINFSKKSALGKFRHFLFWNISYHLLDRFGVLKMFFFVYSSGGFLERGVQINPSITNYFSFVITHLIHYGTSNHFLYHDLGASECANGQARGPVLTFQFLAYVNHCAMAWVKWLSIHQRSMSEGFCN